MLFFLYFFVFCLIIFYDTFKYRYTLKLAHLDAKLLNEGFLKSLLGGSIFISITSFVFSVSMLFSVILNFISINNYLFLYILFALPLILFFIKSRYIFEKELKLSEMKNKWELYLSAFIAAFLYFLLALFLYDFNPYEIIKLFFTSSEYFTHPKCSIIKEMYDFVSYQDFYQDKVLEKARRSSFFLYVVISILILNYFVFFLGILHLYSFLLNFKPSQAKNTKNIKIGFFIGTLLSLALLVFVFILAGKLNQVQGEIGGSTVVKSFHDELADKIEKVNTISNQKKLIYIKQLKEKLSSYIDVSFDLCAPKSAKQIADFEYTWYSDYIKIAHKAIDKDPNKFLQDKISGIINANLPKDFYKFIDSSIKDCVFEYSKERQELASSYKLKSKHVKMQKLDEFVTKVNMNEFASLALGTALATKTISKLLVKSGAKLSAKASTSVAGGSAGLLCGPAAWICIPALATATWIAGDYLISKGDEALNRKEYEKEISGSIIEQKDELKTKIFAQIDEIFASIEDIKSIQMQGGS